MRCFRNCAYRKELFTTTASIPQANANWHTDSNFTTADKYVVMNLVPLHTTNSVTNELSIEQLPEGIWYLWVKAKDKAGNETAVTTANRRKIIVDKSAPALTVTNSLSESGTNPKLDSAAPVLTVNNVDSTQGTNYSFTLTGTAYDTNALNYIEIVDKIGSTLQGTYTTENGTPATKEFTVYKDTSAPTVVIQNPSADASFEQPTVNIRGSVNDTIGSGENAIPGSGPKEIWYKTNNGGWTQLTSYTAGGTIWNDNVSLSSEGTVTLYVKAKDNLGNESTPENVSFYFDASAAELEVEDVDETLGTGYTLTLTGTAFDSNELDYIEIVDKIGDTVQGTYTTENIQAVVL